MMRPVSQETTKRNPSAASKIRCFNSLSVRKDGLYVPSWGVDVNNGSNGDDGGDVNNDRDICVLANDCDEVDHWLSPSLGGVLVIPLKELMWATAILEDVLSMKVVRFCSILPFFSLFPHQIMKGVCWKSVQMYFTRFTSRWSACQVSLRGRCKWEPVKEHHRHYHENIGELGDAGFIFLFSSP